MFCYEHSCRLTARYLTLPATLDLAYLPLHPLSLNYRAARGCWFSATPTGCRKTLMGKNILITGGAGFIGAHVSKELLSCGHRVRVLDSLVPQVHGSERRRPDYLPTEVELIVGDIRDAEALRRALD